MGIKRYVADADNTITNAYRMNLTTRATGANMGLADSLEIFNIYGQESSSSIEQARILIKFPVDQISSDRTSGLIAASSSVNFFLNMYNVKHSQTLPKDFKIQIYAISQSWDEGRGVDMDEYQDLAESNWVSASTSNPWSNDGTTDITGSSYHLDPVITASFTVGTEDLSVDISDFVEQWIAGTKTNYGLLIKMSGTTDPINTGSDGDTTTFYTKKFSARGSEFFFKRPVIEARWDSRRTDDRGNFYYSSSLAPAEDCLNTIYMYNIVRGKLRNIPAVDTGEILVSLFSGTVGNTAPSGSKLTLYDSKTNATGGYVSTGIYSCSVGITGNVAPGTLTHLFDVWHSGATTNIEYFTGSIKPIVEVAEEINPSNRYVLNIANLKPAYYRHETARFRLFTRKKDWSPNIYARTTSQIVGDIIESSSYAIIRIVDNLQAIPYGTGTMFHTYLSYDKSGSFFDLDVSLLEAGYQYEIKFSFYNDSAAGWQEQPYEFKFRVKET